MAPFARLSSLRAACLGMAMVAACLATAAGSARAATPSSKAVTFTVQNVNRSKLACSTDGATYQVKGHLVGPRSALAAKKRRSRAAVTLYLHGLGFGEWFWRFTAVPGYDYATAQARAGHTSVVIDRLGYDASAHPEGTRSCLGGHADVANQIVQQLRQGSYAVDAGKPKRFRKVALAGHSAGAEIANVTAYSFGGVDALIALSFSYSNLPRAQLALGPTRSLCQAGGEPSEPGGPSGYAFFGQPTPADFQSIMFAKTSAPVLTAATALRNRDPCGDTDSIIRSLLQQRTFMPRIKIPVLVLCGTKDALYSSLGCEAQKERYTKSRSVKLELVRGAGHALTLERTASTVRKRLSRWLSKRGY